MNCNKHIVSAVSLVALAAAVPQLALAQSAPGAAQGPVQTGPQAEAGTIDQRVAALEAEVAWLRDQLTNQLVANAQPATLEPRVTALEQRAAAPAAAAPAPAEGFRAAGGTVRFSGFVKVDGVFTRFNDGPGPVTAGGGNNAREFYVPSATPVGGTADDLRFTGHGKQSRLVVTITPTIDGHQATALVELDFASAPGTQGTQNATNAYDLGLRRAYLTLDNWLVGQDWTTFQNVAVLPETTDFIGTTDGTVFVRQPQLRYTRRVSDTVTWQFALENPETTVQGVGNAATGGQDDDWLPDVVARLNLTSGPATYSAAFVARQLVIEQPGLDETATGWGLSLSGKIPFGPQNGHDLRFMVTTGEGIGRYIGLGLIPDAYAISAGGGRLEAIPITSATIAARFKLGPRTRTNIGLAWQEADLDPLLSAGTASESSWSLFANIFFTPVPGTDLGVEYRHGERGLLNGQEGSLDRLHVVAKRGF